LSPARVLLVTGAKAAEALEIGFPDLGEPDGSVLGPVELAGTERLIVYLPHPGRKQHIGS
jgi:hypothetical protein